MKTPRTVSQREKIIFPIFGFILTALIVPSGIPLLGMLFFGNLLKESGVTKRLAETARGPLIDVVTILIGLTVGCSTQADIFLTHISWKASSKLGITLAAGNLGNRDLQELLDEAQAAIVAK